MRASMSHILIYEQNTIILNKPIFFIFKIIKNLSFSLDVI